MTASPAAHNYAHLDETLAKKLIQQAGLGDIDQRIANGTRLSLEDGIRLYETPHLAAVGLMAHRVRTSRHGRKTYFNINQHVNYTNICIYSCKFCAFAAKEGEARGYLMTPEVVEQKVREQLHRPVTEVHMVAGIHPTMGYDYYLDVVRAAKRGRPDIHVKAFTMVEIEHILNISGKSEDEVFADLRAAGLGSCPGGGAEVLVDRVHKAVFREKMGPDRWLMAARKVQRHGFKMNATMLYGHIERVDERVQHLIKLREVQDECGGFMAFIPLAFWPYHTDLANFGHVTTGNLDLRSIAVARLMLDNFPHVKAYWVMLTQESAQTALSFGANDIDGTVTEEKITHEAGTTEPQALGVDQIAHLINEAGYEPVQRTTIYEEIGERQATHA
ncbi:aminodeoxyfutalosine synthase [Planctomycetota bacterium]|jgi:aminodeoxyfutalosine synthase|nr:aminofutalosine synthase MqnE [Planctomycetota bacterium]MSR39752.1 aminofutalosine synthase MqnE [Planctomycetota bacterium]GDY00754.1 aminodeoxyfutalosine synthase [Planctomycetota bacterium]